MIRSFMVPVLIASLLGACATPNGVVEEAAQTRQETSRADLGGLSSQQLTSGECGLFMWTLAEPRKLIFFSRAGSGAAVSAINDKDVSYTQTDSGGEIFGQFKTLMTFTSAAGDETLKVSFVPGVMLDEGQRTEAASLTVIDAEGWETITPVRGVRACQVG